MQGLGALGGYALVLLPQRDQLPGKHINLLEHGVGSGRLQCG